MSTEQETTKEVAVHPLFTRDVRPIYNWNEWLAHWQTAKNIEWIESLLHCGFNISLERYEYGETEYNHIDRIMFYFTIADGWADYYLLKASREDEQYHVGYDKNGNRINKSTSDLRKQIAQKAFDMLCQNFFKEKEYQYEDSESNFWSTVFSEKLFPIIQNFFRAKKESIGDRIEICNLHGRVDRQSHNEQLVVDFLLKLAKFIWEWEEMEIHSYWKEEEKKDTREYNLRRRADIDGAKLWMIEVLNQLDKLDVVRPWMLGLNKPCLDKLKEIAMRSKLSKYNHDVEEDRLVATLDEARLVNSKAAWFLEEYRLKTKEIERLRVIHEAKLAAEKAQRNLERLTAKK